MSFLSHVVPMLVYHLNDSEAYLFVKIKQTFGCSNDFSVQICATKRQKHLWSYTVHKLLQKESLNMALNSDVHFHLFPYNRPEKRVLRLTFKVRFQDKFKYKVKGYDLKQFFMICFEDNV
jgi:hypothetical protein